jgi:hypothetical protein
MTQHIESMVRAVGGIAEATDFSQLVVARFQNFAKKLYVRNRKTQARKYIRLAHCCRKNEVDVTTIARGWSDYVRGKSGRRSLDLAQEIALDRNPFWTSRIAPSLTYSRFQHCQDFGLGLPSPGPRPPNWGNQVWISDGLL